MQKPPTAIRETGPDYKCSSVETYILFNQSSQFHRSVCHLLNHQFWYIFQGVEKIDGLIACVNKGKFICHM